MASISVSPPASDGTTSNYGGITGLTVSRSTIDVTSETVVITMTSPNFDITFNENWQLQNEPFRDKFTGPRTPDNIPEGETWLGMTGTYGANINGLTANGFTFNNTGNLATGATGAIGNYQFYRMTNAHRTRSDMGWLAYFWTDGGMFKKRVANNTTVSATNSPDYIIEPAINAYTGSAYSPVGSRDIDNDHNAYSNFAASGRVSSVSVPTRSFSVTNNNNFNVTFSPSGSTNTVTANANGGTANLQVYNTNEAWTIEGSEGSSLSGSGYDTRYRRDTVDPIIKQSGLQPITHRQPGG